MLNTTAIVIVGPVELLPIIQPTVPLRQRGAFASDEHACGRVMMPRCPRRFVACPARLRAAT